MTSCNNSRLNVWHKSLYLKICISQGFLKKEYRPPKELINYSPVGKDNDEQI
jgi:hypothetical protein